MRIRRLEFTIVAVMLCTLAGTSPLAQGRGRGPDKQGPGDAKPGRGDGQKKAGSAAAPAAGGQYVFAARDRQIITTYYTQFASGLPPGLAKRNGALPPGLEKQLRRNGTLPPGLQKQLQPFPPALERQLSPLPDGYRRGIVGTNVIVYRSTTQKILDVIRDIVR